MPITTAIQIIITLAGQMDRPVPSSPYVLVNQTVHLWELPPANSRTFALRISEGGNTRETQLSAAESEQLTTLLAQLPAHSMTSQAMSFDGITYELMIVRADESLSFHWQNDDWRSSPPSSLFKWERVAALADYALNLAQKKGETS